MVCFEMLLLLIVFKNCYFCQFNCGNDFTGLEQIVKDVRFMLGFGLGIYWKFTWCILIPIALTVIFIYAVSLYRKCNIHYIRLNIANHCISMKDDCL